MWPKPCPVTITIGSGRTSSLQIIDVTSTLTQTTTMTVYNNCAVAKNPGTTTAYFTATSYESNAAVTSTSLPIHSPGTSIPVYSHPVYYNSTGSFGIISVYPTAPGTPSLLPLHLGSGSRVPSEIGYKTIHFPFCPRLAPLWIWHTQLCVLGSSLST